MCTCIHLTNKSKSYFGRNLDLDYDLNQSVLVTPRNFTIKFKKENAIEKHFAFIGAGVVINNFPLYADAINEKGLGIATLNFRNSAIYYKEDKAKKNYAPYELIPLLLATCKNIKEVKRLLETINIIDIDFNKETPNQPSHYMISDTKESIVLETTKDGMKIYDNPYGVLTNNPPFPYQEYNVQNYLHLTNLEISNKLLPKSEFIPYSFGLDAYSLPGDYSSTSRFIKALFVKNYTQLDEDERENVLGFLNVLSQVSMPKGSVKTPKGYEYTRYSTCYDQREGRMYYKTYENPNISVVNMHEEYMNAKEIIVLPFQKDFPFYKQN